MLQLEIIFGLLKLLDFLLKLGPVGCGQHVTHAARGRTESSSGISGHLLYRIYRGLLLVLFWWHFAYAGVYNGLDKLGKAVCYTERLR